TTPLAVQKTVEVMDGLFPGCVKGIDENMLLVKAEALPEVARYLKESPELEFDYLNCISGVDYFDYLEVVYHLTSLRHNHSLVMKVRCHEVENASVPSVVNIWQGADFQEREVFDLVGVSFPGHPNLKRIFLWDGFQGNPLRKNFF
ncbi:MAG: NADH-quinone oxidoreductase subunit C, partial [Dehalococcoidia bacterium]|nr:NADH-quinone oxidoreductase subunit C [Dehalococcoidia bacterium]